MNRRDFLKSLLALGAATSVPLADIASASDVVIDEVWSKLIDSPFIFFVQENNALTLDATLPACPASRAELYGLDRPQSVADVHSLATDNAMVRGVLDDFLYEENIRSTDELDDEQAARLVAHVDEWLSDEPGEWDDEFMTLSGADGRGWALSYFRDEFEFCEDLNIVIVEGDRPGSSYYAAELRMPIALANERARILGLPIRFAGFGA